MNIPDDMRKVLILALQDACRLAGSGGEEEIHDTYMAALECVCAARTGEPHWESVPTENSMEHPIVDDGGRCLYFSDGAMVIEEHFSCNFEYIRLPDGYALCRLVMPEQEAHA